MSLTSISIYLLLVLIVVSILNFIVLWRLQKRQGFNNLKDERYFELKSRIDLIIAVFSIAVFFTAFLGYNSVNDVKEEIENEMRSRLDSISIDLERGQADAKEIRRIAEESKQLFDEISTNINDRRKQLQKLERQIATISNRDILKQNYFIARFVEKTEPKLDVHRIFFKDLKTNAGGLLPKFTTPPVVLVSSNSKGQPTITDITTESFDMYYSQGDFITVDFQFLIFETGTFDDSFDDTFK